MLNCIKKIVKATISQIIVALFVIIVIIFVIKLSVGAQIEEFISFVNRFAISIEKDELTVNSINLEKTVKTENNELKNYPEYGKKYAIIEIPKIDVNLPVYYGDTLEILKNGVGHSSGSYFPGEGGSIIYMGHNSKKIFRRFSELKLGNEIIVTTDYGKYEYKIFDMKVVKETDVDQLPIQRNREILMIYTCYPFNNIGYTTQRYVVYAELEN